MNRSRPTSKQVAERAGVSQTTVSFVLNNVRDANISEETRQRVLEAARELNYMPNVSAQSLARGRTDTIALVLVQPHRQVYIDEYIPRVLTGITEVTRKENFRILLEQTDDSAEVGSYRDLVYSRHAAGLIINFSITSPGDIENILEITRNGMHVVSLKYLHPDIHSVEVDKLQGVQTLIQHLIDLEHQRIACITYDHELRNPHVHERMEVFKTTLEQNNLRFDPALVRYGEFEPDTGYEAMMSILDRSPLPDAVYCMNDLMAFGAIRALQEKGLRIPEDIAVVGFDDVRLSAYSYPSLTTVHEPDEEHGRLAAEMLLALINGSEVPQKHVTLETSLIIRESCGAAHKK
ncbi:LacI family transcriptional regulator [Anaerolineae bacterium CFX9]|jgi:LacI family transcriptional regulator|nr:LacI family DNA-binding transcriptional regulator [Geitlerinema splendidum]MDL1901608.1 LacI family transcriptional regulator [Anaerolineae bacterium CFX9]